MDEAERQRFLGTLREDNDFRAAVRRELLTQELLDLPQTVSTLVEHQAEMQTSLIALAADVAVLTRPQAEMQRAVTVLGDVVGVALGNVRERLDEVDTALAGLGTDTANGFSAMSGRFDRLDAAIAELRAGS